MKGQDFSGGGIKHENCHRRTECSHSVDRVADYISINWTQIGKLSLIVVTQIKASQKLSLFSPLPQRALGIDRSIRHDHSSSVKHSRCLRWAWGLHSNLWNSLNFLTILQRLATVPKKAAKRHYTFLFRFRIRVFDTHHLYHAELNSCACCSCDKPSKVSWFFAQLSPSLIRRNGMRHVQATSSSLMLYPRALILTFKLSSPLDMLSLPSTFCSNDSRTLSALRETFTNASQPTPNVLIRKNSDSQNTSRKGRGSLGSEKNEGVRDPSLPFPDYLTRRLTARVQRTRRIW